ncbi:ACP phosphodiesterase [Poseidonibacter antarcticus]|uniref:acyl carrier protein phosphodiesterase n=1 Tax=Poseidonibacter antarcticus TaxID=2478538 RepID=UPI000EF4E67F|nr:acyl carrier protein phosphodiesterase [Poseidonibacter antarcticus]
MNWLAHAFLSEEHIDFKIGNILADPLKAKTWENASYHVQNGMKTHIKIDSFTDTHQIVKTSKKRLREKGLLKPVIIDLTYDYLLTKNWNLYSNISIEEFTNNFYEKANQRLDFLPSRANEIVTNLINRDLLNDYHTLEQLNKSFKRMDLRLSQRLRKRETASEYFQTVCKNMDEIEKDFLEFFPLLCQHIKKDLDQSKLSHWKI